MPTPALLRGASADLRLLLGLASPVIKWVYGFGPGARGIGLPADTEAEGLVTRPLDPVDVPPGRLYLFQMRNRTLPLAAAKFAAPLGHEIDKLEN